MTMTIGMSALSLIGWVSLVFVSLILIILALLALGYFASAGSRLPSVSIPNPFKGVWGALGSNAVWNTCKPAAIALLIVIMVVVVGLFVATPAMTKLLQAPAFWGVALAAVLGALLASKGWVKTYVGLIVLAVVVAVYSAQEKNILASVARIPTAAPTAKVVQSVDTNLPKELPGKYGWFDFDAPPHPAWSQPTDVLGSREVLPGKKPGEYELGKYTRPELKGKYLFVCTRLDKRYTVKKAVNGDYDNLHTVALKENPDPIDADIVRYQSMGPETVRMRGWWVLDRGDKKPPAK